MYAFKTCDSAQPSCRLFRHGIGSMSDHLSMNQAFKQPLYYRIHELDPMSVRAPNLEYRLKQRRQQIRARYRISTVYLIELTAHR
jgi:hypothetical protein